LNVEITNKTENILLSRIEVEGKIEFSGTSTPSTEDVKKDVSKTLDVDKDLVVIKNINTMYGESRATIKVYQYISKDERDRLEPKIVESEKKAAEKPAEEKKEAPAEKPAEKVAEEKPAEKPAEEKK